MKRLLKRLFRTSKARKQEGNYFRAIPSQALKTWRHFDRFNVELYHDYLIQINQP
jgi:hypothetical protein